MAKQITQESFDDVVRENMQEFDMDVQEAINDAVQQFESQGVNLNNIIRDPGMFTSGNTEHPVILAVKSLKETVDSENTDEDKLLQCMKDLEIECDIDLSRRCLAEKNQAYATLKTALLKYKDNVALLTGVLKSLVSLTNGQPDVLDDEGACILLDLVDTYTENVDILVLTIKLIRFTCIKHENNRQSFVKKGLIEKLSGVLNSQKNSPAVVKETCAALRTLTFDDDVRVTFGKAHEHAKTIVTEGNALQTLLDLCKVHADNASVLKELFSTLAKLMVRDEFCKAVMDMGGLEFILNAFRQSMGDKMIAKQALVVLKALAGNDNVKVQIINAGGAELILSAMTEHPANPAVTEIACATLATVILRNPAHCKKVIELQGHQIIIQAMRIHKTEENVQKQACHALRNLVARTREYCDCILELGAESLINEARSSFKSCNDDAKAALRDLGCEVDFTILWKGEGKYLQQN